MRVFSIEPYPPKYLPRNLSGLTKLIVQKQQSIGVDFLGLLFYL